MAAAAPVTVLSWNIQILGEAKARTDLLFELLAKLIVDSGADVVAIQEVVYAAGDKIRDELIASLTTLKQQWAGHLVPARDEADAPDRDGYLFLWRSNKYGLIIADGEPVAGNFTGNFPSNIRNELGRRPGYVGLATAAGMPFIVAAYHAPTYASASLGSAPATAFKAFLKESDQFLHYTDGGAKIAFGAWFLCADFNMDCNAADATGSNFDDWYDPLLTKLGGKEATRDNTLLMTAKAAKQARPADASGYATQALDNILAGPAAKFVSGEVVDVITWLKHGDPKRIADGFIGANQGSNQNAWPPTNVPTSHVFARTFLSDHLPVKLVFQL